MKQPPQRQRLTTTDEFAEARARLDAWVEGLLAVCRARERQEPEWMIDVRRAQASLESARKVLRLRQSRANGDDQAA